MKLLSVSVSPPREVVHQGRTVTTGIFKAPVTGRVMVRRLNVDGDGQADLRVHGGPDMAVYAYPVEHYAYWEEALGQGPYPHGQFGENLTVQGLLEDTVRVGDIFRVGEALLQVSQPRIPCYKLALRMGQGLDFPQRFQASGRLGFYSRVIKEGEIGTGDAIELIERDDASVTIAEFIHAYLHETREPERLKRVLRSRDLGQAWREYLETALKKAEMRIGSEGWEGYRTFLVDRKVPESETITSFYLRPEDGEQLPAHRPGQFLTFRLEIPGHTTPITRTYTISDSYHPEYYRVSIKLEPAPADRRDAPPGLSSNYFHDHVEPGTKLCVRAPRGKFHLDPVDDAPVVLLSGGVGLTPMISMLNAIVVAGSKRAVWFIHGTRNGREHAMGEHVRQVAAAHDNVRAHIVYSRPGPDDVRGRDYDSAGHVSVELLRQLVSGNDFDCYLCGPTPFMKSLYNGLLAWGVPETCIHYEFFGPAKALKERAEAAPGVPAEGAEAFSVTFAGSGVTVAWDASAGSLLDLAEVHGLHPEYSCRSGICHTCMSALREGEVEYLLEPADMPDPGCVLICCSRPKSDVVIDI